MGEQQSPEHWHLKREVSISHLLTTLALVVSALWWASGVEKRIAVLETTSVHNAKTLQRQLDRINEKLDRLIQRELDGKNGAG